MPRKLRELKADLRRVGFSEQPGKGSHTGWRHSLLLDKLTLSGADGEDAKPYQERLVGTFLMRLRRTKESQS